MDKEITITVAGRMGSGKTRLALAIKHMLEARGLQPIFMDEDLDQDGRFINSGEPIPLIQMEEVLAESKITIRSYRIKFLHSHRKIGS